jgi:hypothetical protein
LDARQLAISLLSHTMSAIATMDTPPSHQPDFEEITSSYLKRFFDDEADESATEAPAPKRQKRDQ